jgi:Curlin associated repeat
MLPYSARTGHHRFAFRHVFRGTVLACSIIAAAMIESPAMADDGATGSFANIEQIADIMARSNVRLVGTGNAVEVTQTGRNLVADTYIEGQLNRATSQANAIQQNGDNAAATVSIIGDQNSFSVKQSSTSFGEIGAGRNDAAIIIEGTGNDAAIQQTNDFGELFFNSASVSQTGNSNTAAIYQTVSPTDLAAGGNTASVTQTGNDNDALIEQSGADNSATIEQEGSGNHGQIFQDGEGLSAILAQTGDALEYTINQTGCVIATGCGTVVVSQGAH